MPAAGLPAAPARNEAVAALRRLEPRGDVRKRAAPISGIGGSPVITALLVQEGAASRRVRRALSPIGAGVRAGESQRANERAVCVWVMVVMV